jgi:prevent-host-death family protein
MKVLSANEAKTQFGSLLLNAQREPVQINKNGKAVAVVMSMDDYQEMESLKLSLLQDRAIYPNYLKMQASSNLGIKAKEEHNTLEGESFFQELISGRHD